MATLVFSAVGTLLGGPIGGAIGALAGRQVDSLLFAPAARQGPRLAELTLSASSYGLPMPRQYGRVRTGGQVIWATDLVEQRNRQGGGKGRPSTVTYAYSASFAVAVSSRPIAGVGRIWADGKLLRGAAGDLKVGGSLRVHNGHADQAPDPLLEAAEGGRSPAYRGLAYVVFEDLQLADYGNRIPALSFEVLADTAPPGLQAMLAPVIADCDADVPLDGLDGITVAGSPAELLDQIDALFPLSCDACDTRLTIRPERSVGPPLALPEATSAQASDSFGRQAGFVRTRSLAGDPAFSVLRHYDPDRDYQPGSQRAQGPARKGQPPVLELPATIAAGAALRLVNAAVKRQAWSRHALSWRICQIDPAIRPGSVVTVPHEPGQWRVRSWEWRNDGTELQLERVTPVWPGPAGASDPGRAASDADRIAGPTMLIAFELPWDGNPATPLPQVFVGAGSSGGAWSGASLYMDSGDGALQPIGSTGRVPAVVGTSVTAPPAGSPLLFDRGASLIVSLADRAANLAEATMRQLAQGANQALLGGEIIQFAWATPLGNGQWRLTGLLRGRGGTEASIPGHQPGEAFVLLDGGPTPLDLGANDTGGPLRIAAIGLGDDAPVYSQISLAGIGWRPLSPVHGTARKLANGGLLLRWTRRTRGGLRWDDGLELPLNEQREAYIVEFGTDWPQMRWDCPTPWLELSPVEWSALRQAQPNGRFTVSQVGDRAVSPALTIDPT